MIARFYYSDGSHVDRIPFGSLSGLSTKIGDEFQRPIRVDFHGKGRDEHVYREWIRECHSAVRGTELPHALTVHQQFAKSLLGECDTTDDGHRKWLSIMRFGMATLQQSPQFLMCLIVERAYQYHAFRNDGSLAIGEQAARIADELGLKLTQLESDGAA